MGQKLSTVIAFMGVLVVLAGASACAPELGDGCKQSSDCSINGDRTCDRSQPGGYCTIVDCSPEACGDEGYCVRFNPDEPRLARDFCMKKCSKNRDCDRDRYVCRSTADLNPPEDAGLPRVAEILDKKVNGKFCVVDEE